MVDDIKQRMKIHGENVTKLISAMRSTVGECAIIGSTIDDKMQMIYEQMREVVEKIQQNASEIKNTIEPALQSSEKNVQQMKMKIIESLDAHLISVNEQKAIFTQPILSDDLKTKQTELKDTVKQKMMMVNDLLENMAINNTTSMDSNRKYIATIINGLSSKRDIIEANSEIPMLRSELNGNQYRLSKQYKENAKVINDISSNTQEMSKKMSQEISACCNELKDFYEMEFCIYEPLGNLHFIQYITLFRIECIVKSDLIFIFTGETPVKRDYDTNVSLAATTPLDRIKQRFRDRLSQINNASPGNYSFLSN